MSQKQLTMYSRYGCELCMNMLQTLEDLRKEIDFTYIIINVNDDPNLAERYGERVPVLVAGNTELCSPVINRPRLREYLRALHLSC